MEQLNLFGKAKQIITAPTDLLDYIPGVFDESESQFLLQKFIKEMPWTQKSVLMYGKEVITPRLTAWFGKGSNEALPWTNELLMIKKRIELLSAYKFDSVLLNYYRDGNDSVSWHSDNDGVPGKNRIVASVSFGQERQFDIRLKADHTRKDSVLLENGSYLLMKGNFQEDWQHRIAKSIKPMQPRVNLTFRILGGKDK